MDGMGGRPLGQLLDEQGDPGLAVSTVLPSLATVAAALDHMHGHRPPVVHGDLRPELVVQGADGRVTLVFGLSTVGGSVPEDIRALAELAATLLTGTRPTSGAPIAWPGVPPELAKQLDRVLRRA